MMTPSKMVLRFFVLAMLFFGLSNVTSAQTFVRFATPTTIASATVCPGSLNQNVYAFTLTGFGGGGANNFTAITFSNSGTAGIPGDVVQYRLWRNAGGGAGVSVATSTTLTFTFTAIPFVNNTTVNFWITADIAASPTSNRTIQVPALTATSITLSTNANKFTDPGGTDPGGTIRILTVPTAITGGAAICEGATVTLSQAAIGGTWTSSNTSVATVNSATRVVRGASIANSSSVNITFANACGSQFVNIPVLANPGFVAASATALCSGTAVVLSSDVTGGTWSSSNSSVATVGAATGVGAANQAGSAVVTYSNGCGSDPSVALSVTANVTAISGNNALCVGTPSSLSNGVTGGTWESDNTAVAAIDINTGVVTPLTIGSAIISYSNGCGTATYPITVNSSNPGSISGPGAVCVGNNITLSNDVLGGVWSSDATGVATVAAGIVGGVAPGSATISYTVSNSCGTNAATHIVAVDNPVNPGVIIGPSTMCAGTFTILTNAVSGGAWSVSNGNATINPATGLLTAVSPGSVIVTYTIANICGPSIATKTINIFPVLNAGTISGPNNVCIGNSVTLSDNVPGGVWSSTNTAVATVSGLGVVTGLSGGTTTISYLMISGCGSVAATYSFTVIPAPDAGSITGPSAICTGTFAMLTDAAAGGVWSSSNTSVATVNASGLTQGVAVGNATIFYTVTNACGSASANHPVTVSLPPNAGSISGPSSVCVGSSITLSDAAPGGVWSTDNGNASVGTTGVVTGVAAGSVTVSYTSTTACGTQSATYPVTVNPLADAGVITGPAGVCVGNSVSLTDATAGGVWNSSNSAIATVDANGNVSTVADGPVVIGYAVTNICGTTTATHSLTVHPLPANSIIAGPTDVCIGSSVILSNATPGGLWSSGNTNVSILVVGFGLQVTGVSAGLATITYEVTNAFGCTTASMHGMSVNSLPAVAPITGSSSACVGLVTTLADATAGGVWSSSDNTVATVDAATGDVTGVATGAATISYTVTNLSGCSETVTYAITVNTVPASNPVTGVTTVCVGGVTTLSSAAAGGTWSSANGNATVSSTGDVTGVAAGTVYIIYEVANACGSVYDSALVTVNPLAPVAPITALYTSLCAGTTLMLNESVSGGVWSSTNPSVATVSVTGEVTGLTTGTSTISYTVNNGSGCINAATITITVGPAISPVAVLPGASATLCNGNPVNLRVASTTGGLTYQWLTGTTPIPGANDSVYIANTAATYSVIINNGTCSVMRSTVVSVAPTPVIQFTAPDILYTGSFSAYQWYVNGNAIPGATSSLIHTMGNGAYTVVVADANGCTDTSAVYTLGATGINNTAAAQSVKIYPNPVSSVLHIEAAVKVNVAVMSFDGKMLIAQKDATNIDVRNLANGMYMIMIYDEHNTLITTSKFAKSE